MNDLHVVCLLIAEYAREASEYIQRALFQIDVRRRAHFEQKSQHLRPLVVALLVD